MDGHAPGLGDKPPGNFDPVDAVVRSDPQRADQAADDRYEAKQDECRQEAEA
jgi:hypothetical protein